jgi:hypothetical protein
MVSFIYLRTVFRLRVIPTCHTPLHSSGCVRSLRSTRAGTPVRCDHLLLSLFAVSLALPDDSVIYGSLIWVFCVRGPTTFGIAVYSFTFTMGIVR